MISIVVCSRLDPSNTVHEQNVKNTIGVDYEYIRIDNRSNTYSLCAAYNEGVRRASGDIIVFVHEDVFFIRKNWGGSLNSKFANVSIGMIGVAGTQYLFRDTPGWVAAGRPFIKGQVIHDTDQGKQYNLTVFSWDENDADVVAVDGLFFAIRKDLFNTIKFDDITFNGFHLYDLDICMQVNRTHRIVVTKDILVKHQSGGNFDSKWQVFAAAFLNKYQSRLPVSCVNEVPDLSKRVHFENVDLRKLCGKI